MDRYTDTQINRRVEIRANRYSSGKRDMQKWAERRVEGGRETGKRIEI